MSERTGQMESESAGQPPTTQVHDIENGIFNLVVTLCQHLSTQAPAEVAREYVAGYLDRLAAGLRNVSEQQETEQRGNP